MLARTDDNLALATCVALRNRLGPAAVVTATDEELIHATWWHELTSRAVTTAIALGGRQTIRSAGLALVFNRLSRVNRASFRGSSAADMDYATMETQALWLSWLASLTCPVVNSITPRVFTDGRWSHLEWLQCAARAGLPVQAFDYTSDGRGAGTRARCLHPLANAPDRAARWHEPSAFIAGGEPMLAVEPLPGPVQIVHVCGEEAFGPLARDWPRELAALRQFSACDLLEVEFGAVHASPTSRRDWRVRRVSDEVRVLPPAALAGLVRWLETRAEFAHRP